ncbi:MAG: class I SAM-dependent methyltransferase [Burkholderiales bacterium]
MPALRALSIALALVCASAPPAGAQAPQTFDYKPEIGQDGKDVVWVPTPDALVDRMLNLAHVTPADVVLDLGSGDGRTVIAAARRGARAVGVEFDPHMVELSRRNARAAGVADRTQFVQGDLFKADLGQATVITLFLLPSINLELRPALLELKPGTRIVSNTFDMDTWQPDARAGTATSDSKCESYCAALLWIVPAKVAGRHAVPDGELELKQEFQMLSGTLRSGGAAYPAEGRVRGDRVEVRAGGKFYRGRASGGKLELR